MSIIIRIDVDRAYGKKTIFRQLLSRVSSDFYFPKIEKLGYLEDLKKILRFLNNNNIRSYIFFRKCTFPSKSVLRLIEKGKHIIGLHLENSRSYNSFYKELQFLEKRLAIKIKSLSKHGSGLKKYGFHHYPFYEPNQYIEWAKKSKMEVFWEREKTGIKVI